MSSSALLNRDIQILIGEQIGSGVPGRYVDQGTFNLFVASPIIRNSAIATLSKMRVFLLNECEARICSADNKLSIHIDFRRLTGYVYLAHLIKLMIHFTGKWITEVYLISLKGMDAVKLFNILETLSDLTVLSLPYGFDNFKRKSESDKMHKLVEQNAKTLQTLHHLTYPLTLPTELRKRVVGINCATLRTGTLEKEDDFFAFYMSRDLLPQDLMNLAKDGVSMRICIHRYKELLRAIKRALQRDPLRCEISSLSLRSIYEFDTKSAELLLSQIERFPSVLPKLGALTVEMRTQDNYPEHYAGHLNDDESDYALNWENDAELVPRSASICSNVANFALDWLQKRTLNFELNLHVQLAVDYICCREPGSPLLERAMRETIDRSVDPKWATLMGGSMVVQNGFVSSKAKMDLSERARIEFHIEFRSISLSVSGPNHAKKNKFRLLCRL